MTTSSDSSSPSGTYDIRVRGHLDQHWADRLGVPELIHEAGGVTLLRGVTADQAVLHGLLQRIRDLGVSLVSVAHVPPKTVT
ncbi:MAG: hypothetical protein J0I99_11220 [Devosia sp.]|uniref:hypothetical protein n=1 Tax=Devosia sp. TaxID=1871048 RepID=UPI001ACE3A63|nr:hypothetical protein [Devosia sp.]MBN9308760.1 hypothetical protein [Devosia sp.]MBN9316301.1 hypothetical protein [Devosia sp.]